MSSLLLTRPLIEVVAELGPSEMASETAMCLISLESIGRRQHHQFVGDMAFCPLFHVSIDECQVPDWAADLTAYPDGQSLVGAA